MAWFWSNAAAAKPPGGGGGTLTTSSIKTPPSSRQQQQSGGGGNYITTRADWFWSTSPTPASVPADQRRGTSSTTASAAPTTRSPPPPPPPQQPAVVDPASYVDPEITKFLNYFKEDMALLSAATAAPAAPTSHGHTSSRAGLTGPSTSTSTSTNTNTSSSSAAMTGWSPPQSQSQSQSQSPPPDIPYSLYPTTMSCSQAFDLARRCQSIPGQLRHVYRYGNFRSCSEHWSDFWFCMRHVGAPSGPVKESLIREHYREKERRKYYAEGCRNSEAVWSSREEKVPPETFFVEPYDPPVESDDEWRRSEIERRRNIREALDGVGA